MTNQSTPTNVLRTLRGFMPTRRLEQHEAEGIAERQALKLLELLDQREPAVDVAQVADLPRIEVRVEPGLPISGFSQWSRGRWLIGINQDDAPVRRRFTLAHELKHVLDHPVIGFAYTDRKGKPSPERAEAICDHFAACLLMPRPWVKQAFTGGMQDQRALAQLFGVSEAAMARRLRWLGLTVPRLGGWVSPNEVPADEGIGRYFRRDPLLEAVRGASLASPVLCGVEG